MSASGPTLRLLSYNVQAGFGAHSYHHYVTYGWRHVLPFARRYENLKHIAQLLRGYDVVGLQEVDSGSLRSGYVNLTQYLATHAHFPFWHDQVNRKVGRFAQHAIGALSQRRPHAVIAHTLPGRIPGRGMLDLQFGASASGLCVVIVHLALGQRARLDQLKYIAEVIARHRHAVVMGDFNCAWPSRELAEFLRTTRLAAPSLHLPSYPSWRPLRNIDHILISPELQVLHYGSLAEHCSDHLPVAIEVMLPADMELEAAA